MNILTLPEDILKEIWSYLEFYDVIRFGLVTKHKLSYSWKLADKKVVSNLETPEQLDWLTKLDLLSLRSASLRFRPRKGSAPLKIFSLNSLIKASHLTSLAMDFSATANNYRLELLQEVPIFLSAFTQLHEFSVVYNLMMLNCGHFAKNRHLTSLSLTIAVTTGLSALTTLKKLKLRLPTSPKLIEEISMLTNLVSLDTNLRLTDNFLWLMRMTDLQKFASIGPSNSELDVIAQLPKLASLKIDFTGIFQNNHLDYSLLGNFTRLTKLNLRPYFNNTNLETLTKLTNLVNLTFIGIMPIEDFSHMKKMTKLTLKNLAAQPNLPPRLIFPPDLKTLSIQSPVYDDAICEAICKISTLRSLSIVPKPIVFVLPRNAEQIFTQQISKLTNLVHIELPIFTSKDLIRSGLRRLPNLVRLHLTINSHELVRELVQLTQLMSFTYVADKSLPSVRLQAPFLIKRLDD